MIYDYYCMDCGNKLKGEEIRFDLGEFLGVRSKEASEGNGGKGVFSNNEAMLIDTEKIKELADKSRVRLVHGQRAKLAVTLRDFLKIMGFNIGAKVERASVLENYMQYCKYGELEEALGQIYQTRENAEVEQQEIKAFKARLTTAFPLSEEAEVFIQNWEEKGNLSEAQQGTIKNIRSSMENYVAYIYIEPEFFENGRSDKLYTVRYTRNEKAANLETPAAPTEIRGYCPVCGKPVLKNAGKCPHELVGLLGGQSSGKTSLVVAMVRELQESFEDLGISFPGQLLCDSRYRIMKDNFTLYDNGWAVGKTPILGTGGTFNATLSLRSGDGRIQKLVTFADIAGELCYDTDLQQVNVRAFREYPLVKACDMYVLCTCIDRRAYGNADGTVLRMPMDAPLQITYTLYEEFAEDNAKYGRRIPPLCIALTKTDMAGNGNFERAANNPVERIERPADYQFSTQLQNLSTTYDAFTTPNIRVPINHACTLYHQMKNKTYMSMMSCSALGRPGKLYTGNIDEITPYMENGEEVPFERARLKDLWRWILKVSGLVSVDNRSQYLLPAIPSFKETYASDGKGREKSTFNSDDAEVRKRLASVYRLFLNQSDLDRRLHAAMTQPLHVGWFQKEEDLRRRLVDQAIEGAGAKA